MFMGKVTRMGGKRIKRMEEPILSGPGLATPYSPKSGNDQ